MDLLDLFLKDLEGLLVPDHLHHLVLLLDHLLLKHLKNLLLLLDLVDLVHLLDLVDTMMRKGNDAGLAVGGFTEEVAGTFAHDKGGAG